MDNNYNKTQKQHIDSLPNEKNYLVDYIKVILKNQKRNLCVRI